VVKGVNAVVVAKCDNCGEKDHLANGARIVNVMPGLRPGFLVSTSSIGSCIGTTLSAQTMQQTSTSGFSGVYCIRASTMEVEEEIDGIGFGHVIAGPIHSRQFLCGRS